MNDIWERLPRLYQWDGSSSGRNPLDVDSDPHFYREDDGIQHIKTFNPPLAVGTDITYEVSFEKTAGANQGPLGSFAHKFEVHTPLTPDPDPNKVTVDVYFEGASPAWTRNVDVSLPYQITQTATIGIPQASLNSPEDDSGTIRARFFDNNGGNDITDIEVRSLELKDPQAFRNTGQPATIWADIFAYPSTSAWVPEQPIEYEITIHNLSIAGEPLVDTLTGSVPVPINGFTKQTDGEFARIQTTWTPPQGLQGTMRAMIKARVNHSPDGTPSDNYGNTLTNSVSRNFPVIIPPEEIDEEEKRKRKDKCDDYINSEGQLNVPISLNTGFDGPSNTSVALVNRSANTDFLPASFGHGWSLTRNEYLRQSDLGTQILYFHNGNRLEAWDISGTTYTPSFPNSYTDLVLETDNTFTMSFRDKRQKSFHPLASSLSGKIRWEKDRNGNTTYFHYNSDLCLEAWSDAIDGSGDPDGRIVRFEYPVSPPNTSCLQPSKMVSELRQSGVVSSQRETVFNLYQATNVANHELQDRLSSVVNPEGESTTFLYYADSSDLRFGKLFQIKDARGHVTVEYDYYTDGDKPVKSETTFDALGSPEMRRDFDYEYNIDPNVTDPNVTQILTTDLTGTSLFSTRETLLHYNANRVLVKREDTIGVDKRTTEYQYNDTTPINRDKVTKVTDHNLEYEDRTYNARGNLLTRDNKNRELTSYTYLTSDPDLVEKITLPSVTVPDPNNPGLTIQEQYEVSFTYDIKNNLSSVTQTGGSVGANVPKTTYFRLRNGVDNASEPNPSTDGQVWKIVDRRWDGIPANEQYYATVFDYHDDGNLKSIQGPVELGSHPRRKLEFAYDDFDNITSVTDELGNQFKSVFDDKDRLIESEDGRGKKAYFDYTDGLMLEAHSPSNLGPSGVQEKDVGNGRFGRTTKMTYDYRGRMTKHERSDSTTTFETKAEYEFTGFSEMYTLVRYINGSAKQMEWKYDELGRVLSMIDSLNRTSSRSYEVFCKEYDSTTARGVQMKNTFDPLCRPKMLISDSEDQERSYDELGRLVSIIQNEKSRYSNGAAQNVTGRRFGTATYEMTTEEWKFEYDPLGRMTRAEYPGGEEILYEYGDADELLKMTDTDGKVTRYTYNQDLSLKEVILERTPSDKTFTYTYDAGGRVTKIEYPDDLELLFDDGTNPGWDANGQLTYMRYVKPSNSSLVRSFQYAYDDSGNRTQMIESNGTSSQDIEWQYRYDWQDRLVQVSRGVGGATPDLLREYVFDESDNRTYMDLYDPVTPLNDKTFWYSYKTVGSGMNIKYSDELAEIQVATGAGKRMPADQADFSSLETFVSDDDGNITSRTTTAGTVSYNWDDLNNLISVELESGELTRNLYDAGSIREEMVKNSGEKVKSFYSGLPTVNETTTVANGNISYFMGHQLLGYEKNGTSYYYITDGLASVRAVINDMGTETASFEHDEFGNELNATGASTKTWVGGLGVHDDTADTRLLYMRRRHYDPSIGRFLNRDPIGLAGGYNLFNYASNNPVTMVDHTGLSPNLGDIRADYNGTSPGPSGFSDDAAFLATSTAIVGGISYGAFQAAVLANAPKVSLASVKLLGKAAGLPVEGVTLLFDPDFKNAGFIRTAEVDGKLVDFKKDEITFGPRGLTSPWEALKTLAHELHHLKEQAEKGRPTRVHCDLDYDPEQEAIDFEKKFARDVLRGLKDNVELQRAFMQTLRPTEIMRVLRSGPE